MLDTEQVVQTDPLSDLGAGVSLRAHTGSAQTLTRVTVRLAPRRRGVETSVGGQPGWGAGRLTRTE